MQDTGAIDPRTHRALAGASRVRVLEHLRDHGAASAPEIAGRVGLHPNTVRLHLETLADAGLVTCEREPRRGPGRPRLLYRAVPAAPAASTGAHAADGAADEGYRMLADVLAGHLDEAADAAPRAIAAGRAWGRTAAIADDSPAEVPTVASATARLVGMLGDLGFAPSLTDGGRTVELHRCPFQQVAEAHSRVVCGVHLGLLQGALDRLGAPVRAIAIEPFVAPRLCLARLDSPALPDLPVPTGQGSPTRPTEGLPS